jgi:hypothetical protein
MSSLSRFSCLVPVRSSVQLWCLAVLGLAMWLIPSIAQGKQPGFVGFVLNSADGTVTIFAAESDDGNVGNNDHPIQTVTLVPPGSPLAMAVSPNGKYAFVSSPSTNAVYKIDATDPTNPSVTLLPFAGTPGGIVTTYQQAPPPADPTMPVLEFDPDRYFVWIADSKNCKMHVFDSEIGFSKEANHSPFNLIPPTGSGDASCGAGIAMPQVVASGDQKSAIFAAFDQVQFSDSLGTPPQPYVYAFDATDPSDGHPLTFGSFTLTHPRSLLAVQPFVRKVVQPPVQPPIQPVQPSDITELLFVADVGNATTPPQVIVSGINLLTLSSISPQQSIAIYKGTSLPVGLASNDVISNPLDVETVFCRPQCGADPSATNDNIASQFYLFVGTSDKTLQAFKFSCVDPCKASGDFQADSVDQAAELPLSGVPTSLAIVPSSAQTNGRASILYVTEANSVKPIELVLAAGPDIAIQDLCVINIPVCGGLGTGPPASGKTIAGGQVYDTAVPVGQGPTGLTFGAIPTTSPALTWIVSYSTPETNGIFLPLQPPPVAGGSTTASTLTAYVDPNVPLSQVIFQLLSMVSTFKTLSSKIDVVSNTGDNNVGCAQDQTTGCIGPNGPADQSQQQSIDGSGGVGTPPVTNVGDVTVVTFNAHTDTCEPPTTNCAQSSNVTLKTKSSCSLAVNGSTDTSTHITITAGENVSATLSCTGVAGDTLHGTITWGDPSSNMPTDSVSGIANGSTLVQLSPASTTHTYDTAGSTTITATSVDIDPNDSRNNYTVAVSNSPPGFSVVVLPAPLALTTTPLPVGTIGSAYGPVSPVQATGGTAPYTWTTSAGTFPPGLNLNSSNGEISGTPTAAGTFNFTIQVKDSATAPQTATKALSIKVQAAGPALSIPTTALPGGMVGSPYGPVPVQVIGGTSPYTWTTSVGTLPAGLSLNSSSGQISGTPTTVGTSNFTIQVKDSSTTIQTATQPLSISVIASGPALTITTTSLPNGATTVSYGPVALQATGGTSPYAWSIVAATLPAGLNLSSSGQISGTPTAAGNSSFIVQVKDSAAAAQTVTQPLSINVLTPANPTIIPNSTSASVLPGQPATYKLGFQGNSADANAVFTVACQGLPKGAACSYSPNPFALDSNGVGTVIVTITTTGPSTTVALPRNSGSTSPIFASILGLPGLLGILVVGIFARNSRTGKPSGSLLAVLVLGVLLAGMSGCGEKISTTTLPCPNCTPNGTSTVVVLATSQHPALQSSVTVALQVGAQ